MSKTTPTVHVAHSGWAPERKATLERLLGQLKKQDAKIRVHTSENREHASVWATRVYAAVAAEDAPGGAIVLNDDIEVHPHLVDAVQAMTADQQTSRMVSFHATHPLAQSIAEAGQPFFATMHLTGPGYWLRRGVAKQILAYFARLPKTWRERLNEDNWCIQMMHRYDEPIWNSLPALVVHDTTVPSSLGYEKHPGRVTEVPWTREDLFEGVEVRNVDYWRVKGEVPFLETSWTSKQALDSTEVGITLGIDPESCWGCGEEPRVIGFEKTGARLGLKCLYTAIGTGLREWQRMAALLAQQQGQRQG